MLGKSFHYTQWTFNEAQLFFENWSSKDYFLDKNLLVNLIHCILCIDLRANKTNKATKKNIPYFLFIFSCTSIIFYHFYHLFVSYTRAYAILYGSICETWKYIMEQIFRINNILLHIQCTWNLHEILYEF